MTLYRQCTSNLLICALQLWQQGEPNYAGYGYPRTGGRFIYIYQLHRTLKKMLIILSRSFSLSAVYGVDDADQILCRLISLSWMGMVPCRWNHQWYVLIKALGECGGM
jgi:hypothetical protein